jgi:Na+-translocating ferredoxin:NAD+ oxidoreductase RnfD subunit
MFLRKYRQLSFKVILAALVGILISLYVISYFLMFDCAVTKFTASEMEYGPVLKQEYKSSENIAEALYGFILKNDPRRDSWHGEANAPDWVHDFSAFP